MWAGWHKDLPIPVVSWPKDWVCGHVLAGIAGSNLAVIIDVCLLWMLGVVGRGLWVGLITRPQKVLPTVVFVSVIVKSRKWENRDPREAVGSYMKKRPKGLQRLKFDKYYVSEFDYILTSEIYCDMFQIWVRKFWHHGPLHKNASFQNIPLYKNCNSWWQ